MMLYKFIVLVSSLIFLSSPVVLSAEERGVKTSTAGPLKTAILGDYHALIIGINAYKEWYPLKTAVKDARALKELLINEYGFDKVLLVLDLDATRANIIDALRKFTAGLKDNDNLLIYYAGHGQLDEFTGDGYWIPVDGKHKDSTTWISHLVVKSILSSERIKAKNIALISDSCYAGALLRSGFSSLSTRDDKYQNKILALSARKSRQVFTSGGLEPVADGGRDGHSLFAYYFLKALKENKSDIIDLENLFFSWVWGPVTEIGQQRPYVGRLRTLMDENGQFVLITRSARDRDWDRIADEDYAAISPALNYRPAGSPHVNPEKPWAGAWDVKVQQPVGGRIRDGKTFVMNQNANRVKSTKDSYCELDGSVDGAYLKGRMKCFQRYKFKFELSPDNLTFSGKLNPISSGISSAIIWGKRKE